jgi:UDP-3-O-[3-hydroxymyristoyl] glucosamine N-acyltransferase
MKARGIAEFLGVELKGDPDVEVIRVGALASAGEGELVFTDKPIDSVGHHISCLIGPLEQPEISDAKAIVRVKDPKLAFACAAELLHPSKSRDAGIHPTAVIAETAKLGREVVIGAYVCIGEYSAIGDRSQIRAGSKVGDNVAIGTDCVLDPNVFIEDNCTLRNYVILHSGVVIGTDGFGFVRGAERYVKFPQVGTVVIDDNVEIGANTCVDRAALGETRIGEGTKIDNLVQIAHNVQIGKRVVIAAQTGISGSTVIEDDCVIGGQVGMGDHARVQSGAVIGSQAGVLPGKIVRPGVWWGTPVQPLDEYKRQNAHVKGLARLKAEVKELQKQLAELIGVGRHS